jgi:hypothetical protein
MSPSPDRELNERSNPGADISRIGSNRRNVIAPSLRLFCTGGGATTKKIHPLISPY